MNKSNKMKMNIIAIISIALLVFADQITKMAVVTHLKGNEGYDVIPGVFQFRYLENHGAAFGILQNQKIFFILIGFVIILGIGYLYQKIPVHKKYIPLRIVAICITAGAIGNMIDRFLYNYVIDFLYFEYIDFFIFNIADCYVTVSSFCLIVLLLFVYKDDELSFLSFRKKEASGETHED